MNNRKKQRINYPGFTLTELLISFLIITTVFGLSIKAISQWQKTMIIHQFLTMFEKQLLLTQQLAVVTEENSTVTVENNQSKLFFSSPKIHRLPKRELTVPATLQMNGPERITFLAKSGNNGRLSRYTFLWKDKQQRIEFQFQLGSGKYVKKISPL